MGFCWVGFQVPVIIVGCLLLEAVVQGRLFLLEVLLLGCDVEVLIVGGVVGYWCMC